MPVHTTVSRSYHRARIKAELKSKPNCRKDRWNYASGTLVGKEFFLDFHSDCFDTIEELNDSFLAVAEGEDPEKTDKKT